MAANGVIVRGIYTGEEKPEGRRAEEASRSFSWRGVPIRGPRDRLILPNVTHLSVHDSVTAIGSDGFRRHPKIFELICHDGVVKIEEDVFECCPRLKRVIMNGVEEVEGCAFSWCESIEHVECKKLEIIGYKAFSACKSLESIDLPSAKVVAKFIFDHCTALSDVKFGKNLESIDEQAFRNAALKRITIPLKSGLFTSDDVFIGCDHLDEVFLVEEAIIHETVDALLLDEWKSDVNKVIDSINQTLPNADAGEYFVDDNGDFERAGEKTRAIRDWSGRVLQQIIHYKVEHYRLLSLAAAALAHVSPNEIVIDSALSFLELPDHVFEGEGDCSATTPALDRLMWENVLQMKQRLLEKDMEIASLRLDTGKEISLLKAKNDEQGDEIHKLKLRVAQLELQVAESGGAIEKNDADGLSQKRPRGN